MHTLRWTLIVAALVCAACEEEDPLFPTTDAGSLGEGQPCTRSSECKSGMVCVGSGVCATLVSGLKGAGNVGTPCASYLDCMRDYPCSSKFVCSAPGSGKKGDACTGHQDCQAGYFCSSSLKCASLGDPGTVAYGGACTESKDCTLGLVCLEKLCTAPPFWKGTTCETDTGTLRAYFEVPRGGAALKDFYRLPFPNDIRLKNGKVDVLTHPDPKEVLPAAYSQVVSGILKAISEDVPGFGPNTAVFLRLSKTIDFNTLVLSDLTDASKVTLRFLNIDKKSSAYGQGIAFSMYATSARGNYICENSIVVKPALKYGVQLLPKTTYAVILRQGLKDSSGTLVAADSDFKTMVSDSEPSDTDLKAAWTAYKPLREFLKDKGSVVGMDAGTVISAAVFTTMDPQYRMAAMKKAIDTGLSAPTTDGLTLCDGVKKSPCDDGMTSTHKCPSTVNADFHELQGKFETPVLQQGTPPFKTPSEGGAIAYDSSGSPVLQTAKKVSLCYALTVPKKATMPSSGWPLVIYAHGTGGNYRSFIEGGTAAALTSLSDPLDSTKSTGFVVLSTDGALHGPRRGTTDSPDALFFNLFNPKAARDNVYQGAADKFQLLRLGKAIQLPATVSPTGADLKIDPKRIYYYGHSQGTVEGIPFLAHEPEIQGTVLSGAGGFLLGSLLAKTKPVNIAGAIQVALADPYLGTGHPLLNLVQLLYEEVDSLNYGYAMFMSPNTGINRKHVFLGLGVADNYTPPGTIKSLGWSMRIRQVKQDAQRCGDSVCTGTETCKTCVGDCGACLTDAACGNGTCEPTKGENCRNCPAECSLDGGTCPAEFDLDTAPVKGNYLISGTKVTAAIVPYASDGTYDDHFVLQKSKEGLAQSSYFLGSAVWDKENLPTIPASK